MRWSIHTTPKQCLMYTQLKKIRYKIMLPDAEIWKKEISLKIFKVTNSSTIVIMDTIHVIYALSGQDIEIIQIIY